VKWFPQEAPPTVLLKDVLYKAPQSIRGQSDPARVSKGTRGAIFWRCTL